MYLSVHMYIYMHIHTHIHKHTNTHVRTCNEEGREKHPANAAVHHRHLGYVYICIHTHTLTHSLSHTYTHTYAPPTRKGRRSAQPTQLCIMATFISLGCRSSSYAHIFDVMSGALSKESIETNKRLFVKRDLCTYTKIFVHEQRPTSRTSTEMHRKNLYILCQKRPIYMKRDLYT